MICVFPTKLCLKTRCYINYYNTWASKNLWWPHAHAARNFAMSRMFANILIDYFFLDF